MWVGVGRRMSFGFRNMIMINRISLAIFFLFLVPILMSFRDIQVDVVQALRTGNAKELASKFHDNISITIKNETGYYSKFQAEMVLNDFFRANRPNGVKQLQRISNNKANYYIIYQLNTTSQTYRVFVRYIESDNKFRISELRIE